MNADNVKSGFNVLSCHARKVDIRLLTPNSLEHASIAVKIDYDILDVKEIDENYYGLLDLVIDIKATEDQKDLLILKIVYTGGFQGNKSTLPKDQFIEMLEINGLITLIQLARSFILSITAQAGINPPIHFPMINVNKLVEDKHKEMEEKKGQ